MTKWIINILLALDQLANAILLGDPDETLSSRAGKKHPWAEKIINRIFWFDPDHCKRSAEPDEGKRALKSEQRWEVFWFCALLATIMYFLN